MGTMTRIRNRAGGIMIVVLALSFGGLWMLQDTGVFESMGSGQQRSDGIIVVDGDPVGAEEYGQRVSRRVQMMEQRGRSVTPQRRDQIRNQIYDQLVNERLAQQEMDRLGIEVTAQEVESAVFGQNPNPVVKRLIRQAVPQQQLPSDGQIDRAFLQRILSQPNSQRLVTRLEEILRRQIRQRKLRGLLKATVHVSSEDVQDHYRRQNLSVDTRYVALPYAQVPDSAVSVSDSERQSYYEEHEDDYRRPKTFSVQYVTRTKEATAEDPAAVASDLADLRSRFAEAENDSLFLQRNDSKSTYSSAYRAPSALDPAIAGAVFPNPDSGTVVGPVFTGGKAHLVKITGARPAEKPAVNARHILIEGDGQQALEKARRLKQKITSGQATFAAVARKQSADPGSAEQGGDLGWFGRGRMAPPFEEAAFSATPGEVMGPVKTNFGYHLIEVQARADQAVQIADLSMNLRPSVATLDETESMMRDVSVFASEEGNFEAQAERSDLKIQSATVAANSADGEDEGEIPLEAISSLGASQQIKNFLSGAEAGATSDAVELDDQFAVVHVEEITPKGYRSLDEVRSQVESQVRRQKKQKVQTKKLRQALDQSGGDLDRLAQAVGTTARAKTGVTFETSTIPALGNDAKFVGTALGLREGGSSGVVAGANGAFVLTATRVNEPAKLTDQKRKQLREQLLQQKQQQMRQQWIAGLRDEATITDNRAQYQ
jgi:peptidylprolyl isomerase/peptidyl-prolyl cis-trans isomerase D